jgi:EAL domain-containing protein (putative c-di-GMP-specific phosphodiesterase class I)/CheY-like chemotaxis protein
VSAVPDRRGARDELRDAIEAGDLVLHYQPKISLADGRADGAEALVRWDHPTRGLLAPGHFVPLAEESGLVHPLGAWALVEACGEARRWRERFPNPPLTVSVNVSARQFRADVAGAVARALDATGLEPALLCLELTETTVMEDAEAAAGTLRALKELGVGISVDDFGTGYSSLAYLRRFPLDELKVDMSFVEGLGRDPEATAIVAAIIAMAQALGLRVVAEGVENAIQLVELRRLGCDAAQGFLFTRPLAAVDFDAALSETVVGAERLPWPTGNTVARVLSNAVVIADDAPDVLQLARLSLATAGFTVHTASSGREALRLVQGVRPACVVLDVMMPDMTGFEVCHALRDDERTRDCTIVMLTSQAAAADKVEAFQRGADDYIVKPFSPRDLVGRVHAAMRRRAEGGAPS